MNSRFKTFNHIFFVCLSSLFLFGSCSFKSETATESGVSAKTEAQDREKLKSLNAQVEGKYSGQIETPGGQTIPVEIGIFQIPEVIGKNNQGQTKLLNTLRVRLRRLDMMTRYSLAEARYIPETGEFLASMFKTQSGSSGSSPAPAANAGEVFAIDGTLMNGQLNGKFYTQTGILGNLRASFIEPIVDTNPSGEANEFNEYIRQKLAGIAGTYTGKIISLDGLNNLSVELKIEILESPKGSGTEPTPVISLREASGAVLISNLAFGIYKPEYTPARLNFSNSQVAFDGTVEDKTVRGTVRLSSFAGEMVVTKK